MDYAPYIKTVKRVMARVAACSQPHKITVGDREFTVLPQVYSPAEFSYSDTNFYVEQFLPLVAGCSFLEIGPGCGAGAITAALSGATRVVAIDINPNAVRNTTANVERYHLADQVDVRQGDMFAALRPGEKFDLIYWNIPWWETTAPSDDWLDIAVFDPQSSLLRRFIGEGKNHLTDGGQLALGYYSVPGHPSLAERLFEENGYEWTVTRSPDFKQETGGQTAAICDFFLATPRR